jgi:hypothetical protein
VSRGRLVDPRARLHQDLERSEKVALERLNHLFRQALLLPTFATSKTYWERRYRLGGTSGEGSQGLLAEFKAETLNAFVRDNGVESVIEFGCGDGRQLSLARYPRYMGHDVSQAAIRMCRKRFKNDSSKSFLCFDPADAPGIATFLKADLTLSLDVVYHLVEESVYARYLADLFAASLRFVIIYSSDKDAVTNLPHVRHRNVTADVGRGFPNFRLVGTIENRYPQDSFCSFFLFERAMAE